MAMTITSNGNVGVGNYSPTQKFEVIGNTKLNNATIGDAGHGTAYTAFCHSSSFNTGGYALLQQDIGETYLNCSSGRNIRVRQNNNDLGIWTGTGLGIGTTAPAHKLDVAGNVNATTYTGGTITSLSNLGIWGSNTALWSSNNLLNKAGGTMTGDLSILRGAGNPTTLSINSTNGANTQSTIQFVNSGHHITCVDSNYNGWTRPGSGHNLFYQSGGHYFNGNCVFDGTIGGNAITALSNMAMFGSNTAVWGSNTARWSSNYGGTLSNLATDGWNRGTFGSNAGAWASNNFVAPTVTDLSVTGNATFKAGLTASAGTATYFPFSGGFANNGKNFIRGTTILADTSNAEKVGIGLTNPTEKFHVNGTSLLKELIVGDWGDILSHISIQEATINGSGGFSKVVTTFSGSFPSVYAVFPTVETQSIFDDVFACSIQSKSTTEIKVITSRADGGTSWGQTITLKILIVGF
jgi:hypothetical protein